jgi:hypothetical protein
MNGEWGQRDNEGHTGAWGINAGFGVRQTWGDCIGATPAGVKAIRPGLLRFSS